MKKRRKKRRRYRRRLRIALRCQVCGEFFVTTRRDAQYDSQRCKQIAYRLRLRGRMKKRRCGTRHTKVG